MTIEQTAKIAHEVNRAFCKTIGDDSQPEWKDAPEWQKESARNGVVFHWTTLAEGGELKPSASHESWLREKIAGGWGYGPVKDPAKKEHPCMVPYDELPTEQKTKDFLFCAVAAAAFDLR